MKRLITLFIVITLVFLLCFGLVSCDRKYNEEEVLSAARILIEKSMVLNEIYWGKGIPFEPTVISLYSEANLFALYELGFYTLDELKIKTHEVFTNAYCENIFESSFESETELETHRFFHRYYQKYADENKTEPVSIMVYSKFENLLPDKVEYLYDTLKVSHVERDTVYVSIMAIVTRDEKSVQIKQNVIALKEEENGWRIDSPTYLKYNDKKDEYEDLLDKKQ